MTNAKQTTEQAQQRAQAAQDDALNAAPEAAEPMVETPADAHLEVEPDVADMVPTSERDEWKEKAYRLAAEMENLRKRTAKEVDDARKFAMTSFARELLIVADNMARAIKSLEDAKADKATLEGVQMVADSLHAAFDKAQIAKVEAMGQKLDPNLHQAMFEVPKDDAEPGIVVQEMQAGYTIAGRLLRPAMVGVSKKN